MKKDKKRALTVTEPWQTEVRYTFGGIELTFTSRENNGEVRKATIILHFCDIGHLAEKLWSAIRERQQRIDHVSKKLRGE